VAALDLAGPLTLTLSARLPGRRNAQLASDRARASQGAPPRQEAPGARDPEGAMKLRAARVDTSDITSENGLINPRCLLPRSRRDHLGGPFGASPVAPPGRDLGRADLAPAQGADAGPARRPWGPWRVPPRFHGVQLLVLRCDLQLLPDPGAGGGPHDRGRSLGRPPRLTHPAIHDARTEEPDDGCGPDPAPCARIRLHQPGQHVVVS